MCGECEQAESLAAVYVRKANRYGWQPPVRVATTPHYDDHATSIESAPGRGFSCAPASAPETMQKVDQCA
jgi:hypothetical protein